MDYREQRRCYPFGSSMICVDGTPPDDDSWHLPPIEKVSEQNTKQSEARRSSAKQPDTKQSDEKRSDAKRPDAYKQDKKASNEKQPDRKESPDET
ncbi:MAG: hypothetical protein LBV33_05480 [Lachnospiraceae bacterium]|jgi:hypothetical protein|nr:hypothetical protein [Lachnospiraceae bacterium]